MSLQPASVSAVPSPVDQALDAVPVGVAILDRELRVSHANATLVRQLRTDGPSIVGRTFGELLPTLSAADLARLHAVARGRARNAELELGSPPAPPGTSGPARTGGDRVDDEGTLLASARPLVGDDGTPGGVVVTIQDVSDERRRSRYVGALQALASGLGAAVAPEDVASTVLGAVLGTLGADRGAVSLVTADGRHLDVVGSQGYRADELTRDRLHRSIDADDPLAEVSRSGEALVFETDAEVHARFPRFERRRQGGGALAAVGMPLARVPTGGIILAWPSERAIGEADRSFLEACSRLAGQALGRVRTEMLARQRSASVAATLAAIAGEVEPESIARTLLRAAMPGAAAQWGAVRVLTEDATSTTLLAREGFRPEVPAADVLPLDARLPSVQAIRDGREVLVPDLAAAAERWPAYAPAFLAEGQRASASVPIVRNGLTIGCLTLGFASPQPFDETQLAYVRALAEATSSALDRARLTESERQSRQLLTATLDQLPIGVFVAEPSRGLTFQNQEVERILGMRLPLGPLTDLVIKRSDVDGRSLPVDEWPITRALMRGETVLAHESQFERPDGQTIIVRTAARPVIGGDGRVQAAVSVFSDVTSERAADEAREAFLGVLSHELRTPVTAIYGGSMLLARHRHDVPETLEPVVDDVAAESLRLLRLVEDLLVIARVERGLPVAAREPVLVQHVVRRVVAEEARRWPDAVFTSTLAPGLPPVLGDSGQLEVVLRNLLGNAAKYGSTGAHVTAERIDGGVRVTVEDDGPGLDLAPDQLFRLFQRGRTAARRASGSGIGLFVCRALIEGMGGRIWAENLPDGGAAFHFELVPDESADA
ncbi:MAG TPA: GAF domain-containing protein [Candidatus Limnocylindrales bacterium]|nr:GAF domain-containing protein [Candidatus Limnocylindrales bacterium]